jgi:tetratricopeptide (TPR) repeat protein
MTIKKAILCGILGLLGAMYKPAQAQPRSSGASSAPTENRFRPWPVIWGASFPDSTSYDFTAYLTLPVTLGQRPVEVWLDSSQAGGKPLGTLTSTPLMPDEQAFLSAFQALMKMDWLDAGLKHRQSLQARPHSRFHGALLANFALLLLAVGESTEGEMRLQRAAQLGEEGIYARRSLVNLLLASGRRRDAEAWVDEALEKGWDRAFHLKAKSFLLRQQGSEAAYESFLSQQISEVPRNNGLRKSYGALLLKQGRYREAAQMFQKAVELNPQDGDSWVALGRAFKEQGLWIFAEESFRHGLRVGTRDVDVFSLYAQIIWQFFAGRDRSNGEAALSEAQVLLEKGLALQLHQSSSARLLYDIYGWLGKQKAAVALRQNLWFHFEGPETGLRSPLDPMANRNRMEVRLKLGLSSTTFPLFHFLQEHSHWPRGQNASWVSALP